MTRELLKTVQSNTTPISEEDFAKFLVEKHGVSKEIAYITEEEVEEVISNKESDKQ